MYLVVIRTAGNQRYIFTSGKRQEIVGASELITRVDGAWAETALGRVFPGFDRRVWRIESHDAELLVAGAGGITALVRDRAAGRELVTEITRLAVKYAPGLDVCGVVLECPGGSLGTRLGEARTELAAVRGGRPGPEARFLRLPLVEDCSSSGMPAAEIRSEGDGEPARPRSAAAVAKLAAYPDALTRLAGVAGTDRKAIRRIVDHLGLEAGWVAVVHADGNGLGEVFGNLGQAAADTSDRAYADALREFSDGVDRCAKRAFQKALENTSEEVGGAAVDGVLPVLPLVLGGDDLTVVCSGAVALPFTRHYLEAFERETASDPGLAPMLAGLGKKRLSAAAGVAVVKRNYPFHFAYELAEELTTNEAKRVKAWTSALAFVVLYESSAPELDRIRRSAALPGGSAGSASPYCVGEGSGDPRARGRRWQDLVRRVSALARRDARSGELLIPRGAVHELREGLCLGRDVAASRLDLLRRRLDGDGTRKAALDDLMEVPDGLVWTDYDDGGTTVTGLPDAVAALPFLPAGEGAR